MSRKGEEQIEDGILPNMAFTFYSDHKITKIVIMGSKTPRNSYGVSISPDQLVDSDLPSLPAAIWEGTLEQIVDIPLEATLSKSVVVWRDRYLASESTYRSIFLSRFIILGCDGSIEVEQSW